MNSNANGVHVGHAKIFSFESSLGDWVQIGNDILGKATRNWLPERLALNGDGSRIVVSAPRHGPNSGLVAIYKYDVSDDEWKQLGQDIVGNHYDWSGYSVSIIEDGSRIAIGAIWAGNKGEGTAKVFDYDIGNNLWKPVGNLLKGEAYYDWFGSKVMLTPDGSHLIVLAPRSDANGYRSGKVWVFQYQEDSDTWKQIGTTIVGENSVDHFGIDVDISVDATRIAIGARHNDGISGSDSGHARIFDYISNIQDWKQIGNDIDGVEAGDLFGTFLRLSNGKNRIAIAAPSHDNLRGHIKSFDWVCNNETADRKR